MKIISFIYERKVIKKILDHLGLYKEDKSKRNRAPPVFSDFVERIIEQYDDGWPDYEEPFVDVQMSFLQDQLQKDNLLAVNGTASLRKPIF